MGKYTFLQEKKLESNLMEETCNKWPVTKGLCYYKKFDPMGLSAPASGLRLYTYKYENMKKYV